MHCFACENRLFSIDQCSLAETLQTESSVLLVSKMYSNTMSLRSEDVADRKKLLTACARTGAQRALSVVKKYSALDWKPVQSSGGSAETMHFSNLAGAPRP